MAPFKRRECLVALTRFPRSVFSPASSHTHARGAAARLRRPSVTKRAARRAPGHSDLARDDFPPRTAGAGRAVGEDQSRLGRAAPAPLCRPVPPCMPFVANESEYVRAHVAGHHESPAGESAGQRPRAATRSRGSRGAGHRPPRPPGSAASGVTPAALRGRPHTPHHIYWS